MITSESPKSQTRSSVAFGEPMVPTGPRRAPFIHAVIRFPWITLALAALALLAHRYPGLTSGWQFDRDAIAHGQVWRFFTAHLTHFGADHLRWDMIAFVVLGVIAERISRSAFLAALGISAAFISAGIWLAHPELTTYRGLSGIDSALYGLVVAKLLTFGWRDRDWLALSGAAVALTAFGAKSAFELLEGTTVFVENSGAFVPVPLAHLFGLASGVAVSLARTNAPRLAATQGGGAQ